MTLIGQHARSGYNVPENSREGVKNGNVDKIRQRQKKQKVHFFLDLKKKNEKHGALRNSISEGSIYLRPHVLHILESL